MLKEKSNDLKKVNRTKDYNFHPNDSEQGEESNMSNWKYYDPKIKSLTPNSNEIIRCIENLKKRFFKQKYRSLRTRLIKTELAMLGHRLDYKVYANRLTKQDIKKINHRFINREFLFDLHWYTESDFKSKRSSGYLPISLSLVVECEWEKNRKEDKYKNIYSAMKYDFQKLLFANADLRLMIFKISKFEDLNILEKHFMRAIYTYRNITPESKFLIIAFHERSKSYCYIEYKRK